MGWRKDEGLVDRSSNRGRLTHITKKRREKRKEDLR